MAPIKKERVDQFRVSFHELAKAKRGEPVQVDPFLIARAVALVMRECTVRSAAGRPLLWNEYRVVLARPDFDLVRSLQGALERDLQQVLAQEAQARQADLVGPLRITVVYDEADELRAGEGAVRVAFVAAESMAAPRAGEMTVLPGGFAVAGEIASRPPQPAESTVFVQDTGVVTPSGACAVQWPGGEVALPVGSTTILGRPHAGSPAEFVSLTAASAKVNKQHFWISVGTSTVRIGRFPTANPVQVNGQPVAGGTDVEVALPAEVALSHGDLVLTLRRS